MYGFYDWLTWWCGYCCFPCLFGHDGGELLFLARLAFQYAQSRANWSFLSSILRPCSSLAREIAYEKKRKHWLAFSLPLLCPLLFGHCFRAPVCVCVQSSEWSPRHRLLFSFSIFLFRWRVCWMFLMEKKICANINPLFFCFDFFPNRFRSD